MPQFIFNSICIILLIFCAMHCAEIQCAEIQRNELEMKLLNEDDHGAVVIRLEHDIDVSPNPQKFKKILSESVPCFPDDIHGLILQYTRWKRDYEGEERERNLRKILRGLQTSRRLCVLSFLGGTTELVCGLNKFFSGGDIREHHALVAPAQNSWEVPFFSTIFGVSTLASLWDCYRNIKARELYEVGKCGSRSFVECIIVSTMGACVVNLAGDTHNLDMTFLLLGGIFSSEFSLSMLNWLAKTRKKLQFLELNHYLRKELFVDSICPYEGHGRYA